MDKIFNKEVICTGYIVPGFCSVILKYTKAPREVAKEKSEPFYEYLQLVPNPDFFQPHVEFGGSHDVEASNDQVEILQKQRMQEQR